MTSANAIAGVTASTAEPRRLGIIWTMPRSAHRRVDRVLIEGAEPARAQLDSPSGQT